MAHISLSKNGLRNTRSLKNKPNELEKKIFTRRNTDECGSVNAGGLKGKNCIKKYGSG